MSGRVVVKSVMFGITAIYDRCAIEEIFLYVLEDGYAVRYLVVVLLKSRSVPAPLDPGHRR
jgi:hypothetical protein